VPKTVLIWGKHAVGAALNNKQRDCYKILATKNVAQNMALPKNAQITDAKQIDKLLGNRSDIVHQGIVGEFTKLPSYSVDDLVGNKHNIIVLDQITDPHNVGAILRTANAFNFAGIIMLDKNSPPEGGVMAKSASGALEHVKIAHVNNISNALQDLKTAGYWCVGMDSHTSQTIDDIGKYTPCVLVMGAEGRGLRKLVAQNCDILLKIPMNSQQESLNVSNAAAIACYELGKNA